MTTTPDLTPQELAKYFPAHRPLIKHGVFEIGLVLGGTVSAGSYTAGVLDYLFEALDAWQRAKEDGDPDAPPHEVVISTIAGASGGGINGGLVLRSAGWAYPHGPDPGNPLYSSWATGVNLQKLLAPGPDRAIGGFTSVLNCTSIEDQAVSSITFAGQPLGSGNSPAHRSFLANPLRLFMTVGNLNGLPYRIRMAGETALSHELCSHADHMRFALTVAGGVPDTLDTRPDEVALISGSETNWNLLRDAALATCAFPLAFLSRKLSRLMKVCGWRVAVIPSGENGNAEVAQLVPVWDALAQGELDPTVSTFLNVDGGTFNNEPLDLVRTALSGFIDRNNRSPSNADRAVIMIDPFSDPQSLARPDQRNFGSVLGAILNGLIFQARFKPEDVALAYNENVYSRFLIAPVGPGPSKQRTVGEKAIAAGALGGFSGFVDTKFLDYDFKLGRYNAYKFLKRHFALPVTLAPPTPDQASPNNPVFNSWTNDQRNNYAFANEDDPTDTKTYLPLIPLMRQLRDNPPASLDNWPALTEPPAYLKGAIEVRLQSVYDMAKANLMPDSWWKRAIVSSAVSLAWTLYIRGALRDAAVTAIHNGLVDHGLLPNSYRSTPT